MQAIESLSSFLSPKNQFLPPWGDIPPVESQTLDNSCHPCQLQEPLCHPKGCLPFYTIIQLLIQEILIVVHLIFSCILFTLLSVLKTILFYVKLCLGYFKKCCL